MSRFVLLAALSAFSFSAFAGCDKVDAVFENEHASSVLSVLATEAGLQLVNPELAAGRINATFEGDDASRLLPVMAWDLGFELRIQGRKAWLHKAAPVAAEAQSSVDAGV